MSCKRVVALLTEFMTTWFSGSLARPVHFMQLAMGLYTSMLCAFYYQHFERTEIGQHVVAVLYTTETTQLT